MSVYYHWGSGIKLQFAHIIYACSNMITLPDIVPALPFILQMDLCVAMGRVCMGVERVC